MYPEAADPAPLLGLVLAGGKSTRMGVDKAGLVYCDAPHAFFLYRLLEEYCERVFVSDRHEQSDELGHGAMAHIFDQHHDIGPMGGILSAIQSYPENAWLVVACDLPRLDRSTVAALIAGRDREKSATAFRNPHDGLPEPFCAIYEPALADALVAAYRRGEYSPRDVLRAADPALLDIEDASLLDDANDPEARSRALAERPKPPE